MTEKKIATSVEVLVKVAQYESIRITKYGEAKIEYESDTEMQSKEDQLNNDVMADIVRSMEGLPKRFSKASPNVVAEFGDKITTKLPDWLENGPEPNIANVAKTDHEKSDTKAHASDKDKKEEQELANEDVSNLIEVPEAKKEENTEKEVEKATDKGIELDDMDEDLFGDS